MWTCVYLKFLQTQMGIWKPPSSTTVGRQSLKCFLHSHPIKENCLEEQLVRKIHAALLAPRNEATPQFACGFDFWFLYHHTLPWKGSAYVLSKASCNCGFLMWVLIYSCLDQTAALFLPFQYSFKDVLKWFTFALAVKMKGSIFNWCK